MSQPKDRHDLENCYLNVFGKKPVKSERDREGRRDMTKDVSDTVTRGRGLQCHTRTAEKATGKDMSESDRCDPLRHIITQAYKY